MADYQSFGGAQGGAGGGAGGGGYMAQGYNTSPSSQTSPGGDGKKERINTQTPLSCRQILNSGSETSDDFFVDGKQLGSVTVLGVVREVDNKTTKKSYKIEDHTGILDVSQWVEEADDGDGTPDCREGMYVRAIGHIKQFKDAVSVNAFHVAPISSGNEVTQHLLDIVLQHLKNTKGVIGAPAAAGGGGAMGGGAAAPMGGVMAGGAPAQGGQFAFQQNAPVEQGVGTPVQNSVLTCIKQHADDEQGVSVATIVSTLNGRFAEPQIREALDFLSNEGHVYSTIDDEHYASTDA